ncbi:MAG TPA: carboxypeptidase-like regulatory domain-containing protein [Terriglobia bacterium]|nr:carboxypeptidase-like regulatory domain-containing protein [Terriglobia bacterium]
MRSLIVPCLLLFVTGASAQNNYGTITGSVSDTARSPVAGVSIQAKNVETGAVHKAASVQSGSYTLSQLPPGKYELTATSFGFKRYERKDVVMVQAGQTLRADIPIGDFVSLETLGEDRANFGRLIFGRPKPPEGPAPRTPDGKPDFSGVWNGPLPGGGVEAGPELLPWAQTLEKERTDHNLKDNPQGHCLPFTVTPFNFLLNRVIQSRDFLVTIIEYDIPGYRQVYLDGRGHPKDFDPSWTGHSVGTWEGDTLVIDTVGFNDKTWLGEAVPHTDKLRVTTRLRRPDLGHLEIETTFDDPGAFNKPWKTKGVATLAPATEEILEFICNENNQDVEHLIGK